MEEEIDANSGNVIEHFCNMFLDRVNNLELEGHIPSAEAVHAARAGFNAGAGTMLMLLNGVNSKSGPDKAVELLHILLSEYKTKVLTYELRYNIRKAGG